MNERFEPIPSNPEADAEVLRKKLMSIESVADLAEVVYDSGDVKLIEEFNLARIDFLLEKMPEAMQEFDKIDVPQDEVVKPLLKVDNEGFLYKNGEKAQHITSIDSIAMDRDFVELVRPLLLNELAQR